jgi:hypothetical protein
MTKTQLLSVGRASLLVLVSIFLHGCVLANPLMYAATSIEAWVKDADTGQPLEGVIVVAQWELRGGLHPGPVGSLTVLETVTDATGRFTFYAWGPRVAPLGTYFGAAAPRFLFFKPAYEPSYLSNTVRKKIDRSLLRHSEWDGKTILLKKFMGSEKEWAKQIHFVDDSIDFAFDYHDCSWKQIPRILVEMHQERLRLDAKGVKDPFSYIHTLEDRDEGQNKETRAKCGPIKEYVRSYLP